MKLIVRNTMTACVSEVARMRNKEQECADEADASGEKNETDPVRANRRVEEIRLFAFTENLIFSLHLVIQKLRTDMTTIRCRCRSLSCCGRCS